MHFDNQNRELNETKLEVLNLLPTKLCILKVHFTSILIFFSLTHHVEATQWKPWGQFLARWMVHILLAVRHQGMLISGRLVRHSFTVQKQGKLSLQF